MSQRAPRSRDDERVLERYRHRAGEWLLLTGNRGIVAIGIAVGFLAFFSLLTVTGLVPLRNTQALFYAYSGLIAGNLTLITVIVSINQLLLSRELQTPDEVRSQIQSVTEYRNRVEDATDEVAPVKPLGFLRLLVEATREEAQRLGGLAADGVVAAGHDEIDDVVSSLTDQMDEIDRLLQASGTGTFNVLSLMLETNYAEQINQLRAIRQRFDDDLDDVVHESIDDLIERLQEIDIARQYFKSIYIQQELSALSRVLLYAGLPAVAVAVGALLALTVPTDEPAAVTALPVLLPVSLTIAVAPLAILCAFFLRTATVTKLTAATLPFTTPEQER